jgi:hypothetical protein
MNGEPLSSGLYILIILLYSVCAIATFYCLLTGFYVVVNPEQYTIFHFLKDHWKRVLIALIPIALIFWCTASYSAVYCKVAYESYSPDHGYYYHKMSLFLPVCANVGAWSYGALPEGAVPGLTLGNNTFDGERVILRSSLAGYLLGISAIISAVSNYIFFISREKHRQIEISES